MAGDLESQTSILSLKLSRCELEAAVVALVPHKLQRNITLSSFGEGSPLIIWQFTLAPYST